MKNSPVFVLLCDVCCGVAWTCCGRSLQVAEFLLAMFKKRQVVKHYWVITKGVPQPEEGL